MNGAVAASSFYEYNPSGQITQNDITGAGLVSSNLKLSYDNSGRVTNVGVGVAGSNYFYSNYKYSNNKLTMVQTNGFQADSASNTDNVTYDYYTDGKLRKNFIPETQ